MLLYENLHYNVVNYCHDVIFSIVIIHLCLVLRSCSAYKLPDPQFELEKKSVSIPTKILGLKQCRIIYDQCLELCLIGRH